MKLQNRQRSAIVQGYLKGWLAAKREDGQLFADVPFRDLHPDYKAEVIAKARAATKNIRRRAAGENYRSSHF